LPSLQLIRKLVSGSALNYFADDVQERDHATSKYIVVVRFSHLGNFHTIEYFPEFIGSVLKKNLREVEVR
jgi:hypothetical protein